MLYLGLGCAASAALAAVAYSIYQRRQRSARALLRGELQREHAREWALVQWLFGRRGNLRLTHQPEAAPEPRED